MTEPVIIGEHRYSASPQPEDFVLHTHDTYEILCFLSGNAEYVVEGHVYPLRRGDLMLMCRSETHRLAVRSAVPYERMTVSFSASALTPEERQRLLQPLFEERPLGRFNRYEAALFPDRRWDYYIRRICEVGTPEERRYYLLPLLYELTEASGTVRQSASPPAGGAAEIAAYINRHLFEELSLSRIGEHFYLSRSQLNRVFRRQIGSSVWEYVTVKRLFAAKAMLAAGEAPTRVAEACGFREYTAFFRAYKRHFGVSPQRDRSPSKAAETPPSSFSRRGLHNG